MRVLITGMSGTGKSSVIEELRRRGYAAYDADDHGFSEPSAGGSWRWRTSSVAALLRDADSEVLFFAGCSDEQATFHWDHQVLLTAPVATLLRRLDTRRTNDFGKRETEKQKVVSDLRTFEPLLRRTADTVVDTTRPLGEVVNDVLDATVGTTWR